MEGLNMKTTSFSKGFPCGYQWNCILKIIACLCFVSIFFSLAGAIHTSGTIEHGTFLGTDRTDHRDVGVDAASRHFVNRAE
jgi:hypothetical protein